MQLVMGVHHYHHHHGIMMVNKVVWRVLVIFQVDFCNFMVEKPTPGVLIHAESIL